MSSASKTTTIKLTNLETAVLRELFFSAQGNGHDFGFTEEHGLGNKRQAGGVIASLEKKGVLASYSSDTTRHSGRSFTQFVWTLGGSGPEADLPRIAALAGLEFCAACFRAKFEGACRCETSASAPEPKAEPAQASLPEIAYVASATGGITVELRIDGRAVFSCAGRGTELVVVGEAIRDAYVAGKAARA
jgi:hypothetical protein